MSADAGGRFADLLGPAADELADLAGRISAIEDCISHTDLSGPGLGPSDRSRLQDLDHVRQSLDALAMLFRRLGEAAPNDSLARSHLIGLAIAAIPLRVVRERFALTTDCAPAGRDEPTDHVEAGQVDLF
jgi:hypothetical protein